MVTFIVVAAALVGATGLILGMFLGVASEKFKVNVDETEAAVRAALPGNNCGACGFPGCDGCAKAIASGEAPANQCPVGGQPVAEKIAAILGTSAGDAKEKQVAFVRCQGDCSKAKQTYKYSGIADCADLSVVPNGSEKECPYSCCGYGSCVKACQFDAIHLSRDIPEASSMHTAEEMMKCVGPYAAKRSFRIMKYKATGKHDYPTEQS